MSGTTPLILKLKQSGILTEEDYQPLSDLCAAPNSVPAGQTFVRQGDEATGAHLVLSGFACRYKLLVSGERQIVGVLLPGDFCDLQAGVLRRSDHCTATITDCSIQWLSQETIDGLTLTRSRIARALWWSTLIDGCILREWLANMGQREANQWLAHLLCELLIRLQVVGCGEADSCELPFTQEQLGDILGVSNVHVNRVMKELRAAGLLELKARRLKVPDVAKLRSFCWFDPSYLHLLEGVAKTG